MARGGSRPRGGRPPGRSGGAGSSPAPPPKTGGHGKGTTHKSSSVEGTPIIGLVYGVAAMALLLVGTPIAGLIYLYATR